MNPARSDIEQLVRRHYADWSAGDADAVAQCYAPGCVFEDVTLESRAEGPDAVRDLVAAVCEAIPDLKWHIALVAIDGQNCTCECRFEGTLVKDLPGIRATGKRVDVRELVILVMKEGRIHEYRGYWSLGMLMRQLGHALIAT